MRREAGKAERAALYRFRGPEFNLLLAPELHPSASLLWEKNRDDLVRFLFPLFSLISYLIF